MIELSRSVAAVTIAREHMLAVNIPNGTLISRVGTAPSPVWMVISGSKYGYTSWEKFIRVQKPDAKVFPVDNADSIPDAPVWGDDIELITAPNSPVFLLSNGIKHGFTSGDIFNAYQYDWSKIHSYSVGALNAISSGWNFPAP